MAPTSMTNAFAQHLTTWRRLLRNVRGPLRHRWSRRSRCVPWRRLRRGEHRGAPRRIGDGRTPLPHGDNRRTLAIATSRRVARVWPLGSTRTAILRQERRRRAGRSASAHLFIFSLHSQRQLRSPNQSEFGIDQVRAKITALIHWRHAMPIPNAARATIATEKLTAYLLNPSHKRGGAKAKRLLSLG